MLHVVYCINVLHLFEHWGPSSSCTKACTYTAPAVRTQQAPPVPTQGGHLGQLLTQVPGVPGCTGSIPAFTAPLLCQWARTHHPCSLSPMCVHLQSLTAPCRCLLRAEQVHGWEGVFHYINKYCNVLGINITPNKELVRDANTYSGRAGWVKLGARILDIDMDINIL